MKFELDTTVNALYLTLLEGKVARSVEVEEGVYMDVDKDGRVLGLEFIDASGFIDLLTRHGGQLSIPERVNDAGAPLLASA
jgi:uncharacterized protein YuzE